MALWPQTWSQLENYARDLKVSKIRLVDMAVSSFCRALDLAPKTRAAITANERASEHDYPPRASRHDKKLYLRFGSVAGGELPKGSTRVNAGLGKRGKAG